MYTSGCCMGCFFPGGVFSSSSCHRSLINIQSLGYICLKAVMKLSSSASEPILLNTAATLSFLWLIKQLIVNPPDQHNLTTSSMLCLIQSDRLMHTQTIPISLSAALMHMRQIQYGHLMHIHQIQSTVLIHAQHMRIYEPQSCPAALQKAPMNNLNNPVLLLWCHLVIARQAQPSSKDIGSNILKSA